MKERLKRVGMSDAEMLDKNTVVGLSICKTLG